MIQVRNPFKKYLSKHPFSFILQPITACSTTSTTELCFDWLKEEKFSVWYFLDLDFLFEFRLIIYYLASSRKLPIDGESSKIAQSGCIHYCQKSQIETHAEISHGQIANQKSRNIHFASGSY